MNKRFAIVNHQPTMLVAHFERPDLMYDIALTVPDLPLHEIARKRLMHAMRENRTGYLAAVYGRNGEHVN